MTRTVPQITAGPPPSQHEAAYRQARQAMLDGLAEGVVDTGALRHMQDAMARVARVRVAFGAERYDELRALLNQLERLPVINHQPRGWHHQVPYPYQFKWDGPWLFVLMLIAVGFTFKPLWLLAGFITFMRCLVWCGFRFPLTTMFFASFISGLLGGGRRGRW